MKKWFFLTVWAFLGVGGCSQNVDFSTLTPEQWQEDIRFFMEQAPKTHINLYHTLPKSRFDSIGGDLLRRTTSLDATHIRQEMVRWVAALGDGHSNLTPEGMRVFPILPFWFKDGFLVIDGQKDGQPWKGWKLLKINDMAVETVAANLRPYQQRDGEQQIRAQVPNFMVTAEALQAIGVISDLNKASFTFQNPNTGEIKTAELTSFPRADLRRLLHGGGGVSETSEVPLYRQHRDKFYWFEWLPASKTLYFQYNVTQEEPHGTSVADFIKKLQAAVEEYPLERFVVDLRWNGGGNLFTAKPFTAFIAGNAKINQRGKLFVLLGRHTFSAASWFTSSLEFKTKAIFVGEPTGALPNHYGDPRPIRLPHSGLQPNLSTIYWQNSFPWDKRPATQPDILVEPTAADWLANKDAALEAVWAYQMPVSSPETPLDPKVVAQIQGVYLFNGEKPMRVTVQNDRLHLSIQDWIETDLYPTPGGTWASDVRTLVLRSIGDGKCTLEAFGGSINLERLPADYKFPDELLRNGKVSEALEKYRNIKKETPQAFSVSENELNRLGYELMNGHQMEAARAVFTLNTEFYPNGFNTWDSLAEFYMKTGDKPKAIEYYKKSIALNPNNENGKKMLDNLE